jgi:diguanylate cyclase (GGDEF)-like protein
LGPKSLLAVVGVGAALGGLAVVALPGLPSSPVAITPSWWLIALAFAACEVWPFRARVHRFEQVVSLTALPLVVGLFALSPAVLLLTRVAAAALVFALLRGRTPTRAAVDLGLDAVQTALAGAAMWVLAGGHDVLTVQGWVAALVAVASAQAVEFVSRLPLGPQRQPWREVVRGRRDRAASAHAAQSRPPRIDWSATTAGATARQGSGSGTAGEALARCLIPAGVVGLAGLLLATGLALGSAVVLPATPAVLAAALGYRLYVLGLERAEGHERLLGLSERLRDVVAVEEVAALVVAHVTDLLGARHAELVIGRRGRFVGWSSGQRTGESRPAAPRDPGLADLRPVGARPATPGAGLPGVGASIVADVPADHPTFASVFNTPVDGIATGAVPGRATTIEDGEAVLDAVARLRLSRGMGDPLSDDVLAARHLNDAVVLALAVGDGLSGALLVGERSQLLQRGYRDREVTLLRTVANQASLALQHALALERLRHEATHDQLTGLPNRQQFRHQSVQALNEAVGLGRSCAVGVLDLDGFKTVNDSLGHLAGDMVLAKVGRRMAQLRRDGLQVCRLGGDEFAVLVRGVGDEDEAVALSRRLLDRLHEPFDVLGDQVRLTGSLGLALAPRDGVTPEQLLRNADVAMYAAKEEAGGVRVYARELTETLDAPLSLAADLRLALARGDVTIAVQPLVDLASGRLHSVEALARWRHPVLGVVNPEVFVMAAERVGLVGELTTVVIEQALRACQSWLAGGLEVQVAVNLAARTLSDPDLPEQVEQALHRFGVPGRLLCLELTETGVISSPDRALAVLARLRELGVRLAVDDFGTGYSSMTYMNWLAPDQVKIDKGFVQRLLFDPRNEAIVRSIIDLAHNLDLEVVAEGVGDARTATRLADLGCTIGQGFLFAEPMLTEDLPDWVSRWMSVPERDEMPDTEADLFGDEDGREVVMARGMGGTGGITGLVGPVTGPVGLPSTGSVVLPGPGSGSMPLPAAMSAGAPRGDDGEGEVRLHVVR